MSAIRNSTLPLAFSILLGGCDLGSGPGESGMALDSIRPRAALVGASELTVRVWGDEVTDASTIRWGDVELATTSVGAGRLEATIPAIYLATADSIPITGIASRDTLWFLVVTPRSSAEKRVIAGGSSHTCAIGDDAGTRCWGANANVLAPEPTGGLSAVRSIADDPGLVHISAGGDHACGLAADGTAYCWGAWSPALGREYVGHDRHTPTPVETDLRFTDLETARAYTCGVTGDGEVYCWGREDAGQLGDGRGGRPEPSSTVPIRVPLDQPVVSVSLGDFNACALGRDARLYCWGSPTYLGRADGAAGSEPGPVTSGELYLDVAVADGQTCALTVHRDVDCWTSDLPERYAPGPFTSIRDGGYDFCTTAPDGTGWCWGDAPASTLGTEDPGWTPSPVLGGLEFRQLAMGPNHYCGIADDGLAYCWGRIGSGTGLTWYVPEPVAVETAALFTALDAAATGACGLTTDERILCWGQVAYVRGQDPVEGTLPIDAAPGLRFRDVSVGNGVCGIRTDGTLSCWPSGFDRPGDWDQVVRGSYHGCALDSGGAAYCWGSNADGQLGDGTTENRSEPIAVAGGFEFSQISVGRYHTCALTVDGEVLCWGWGGGGGLGVGDTNDRSQPTLVAGGGTYRSIASAAYYSCAQTAAGDIDCWGMPVPTETDAERESVCDDHEGAINLECFTAPARIRTHVGLDDLELGSYITCGLDDAGRADCWGSSLNRERMSWVSTAQTLGDGSSYRDIAVGRYHICGLADDGTAYCWGYNDQGVLLGVSGAPDPSAPTPVPDAGTY